MGAGIWCFFPTLLDCICVNIKVFFSYPLIWSRVSSLKHLVLKEKCLSFCTNLNKPKRVFVQFFAATMQMMNNFIVLQRITSLTHFVLWLWIVQMETVKVWEMVNFSSHVFLFMWDKSNSKNIHQQQDSNKVELFPVDWRKSHCQWFFFCWTNYVSE